MTNIPSFGFTDLSDFKPKTADSKSGSIINIEEVDAVAENLGFETREKQIIRRKRKGVSKPTDQFNLRAHIEDINKFIDHAEKSGKSYRELFEQLVSRLE